MADAVLTDLQERALIALAEIHDTHGGAVCDAGVVSRHLMREAERAAAWDEWERWKKVATTSIGRALSKLALDGYVHREWSQYDAAWRYAITDEGLALCESMGD